MESLRICVFIAMIARLEIYRSISSTNSLRQLQTCVKCSEPIRMAVAVQPIPYAEQLDSGYPTVPRKIRSVPKWLRNHCQPPLNT
jgi:hypothetical protein